MQHWLRLRPCLRTYLGTPFLSAYRKELLPLLRLVCLLPLQSKVLPWPISAKLQIVSMLATFGLQAESLLHPISRAPRLSLWPTFPSCPLQLESTLELSYPGSHGRIA